MSNFHSTVTRRDFMKGLGLAGVGVGGASLVTPAFHDLDELATSSNAPKRAWYIKERDLGNPTVELDFSQITERYDMRFDMYGLAMHARYIGIDGVMEMYAKADASRREEVKKNTPGFTLRDFALQDASMAATVYMPSWIDTPAIEPYFTGNRLLFPKDWGVPNWQGTPEENTAMMRSAMRFYGANEICVVELNDDAKKLLPSTASGLWDFKYLNNFAASEATDKKVVFEDVDRGYETPLKLVLPNKPLWVIIYSVPHQKDMWRSSNSALAGASNDSRYRLRYQIQACTKSFLRSLGYQGMEDYTIFPCSGGAVLGGLAEQARFAGCLNPEFGSAHGYYVVITDLPLVPSKPIDAGMWRFCQTCGKCADNCPSGSLPKKGVEPTWDPTPSSITPVFPPFIPGQRIPEYHRLGKKVFWSDSPNCLRYMSSQPSNTNCQNCMGSCTFNVNTSAGIHTLVQNTIANTSVFNSFFFKMHSAFGYGLHEDKEEFWKMSFPQYGFDTTR